MFLGSRSEYFNWKCTLQSFKLDRDAGEAFNLLLYSDDDDIGPEDCATLYRDFSNFKEEMERDENLNPAFKRIYCDFLACFWLTANRGVVRFVVQ